MAIHIFDKYLITFGHWNLKENELDYLICESIFIAAKLEQAKKPKINNLIFDYRALTKKVLDRAVLLQMEEQLITEFAFDFNISQPEHFIDRYLRVLAYHMVKEVAQSAIQILTLHFIDERLLQFPVSKIAACSVILAVNIFKLKEKFINKLISNTLDDASPS